MPTMPFNQLPFSLRFSPVRPIAQVVEVPDGGSVSIDDLGETTVADAEEEVVATIADAEFTTDEVNAWTAVLSEAVAAPDDEEDEFACVPGVVRNA